MPVILNMDLSSTPNLTKKYQLEGTSYYIKVYWNPRAGWFIDLQDKDKVDIISGISLRVGISLYKDYNIPELFKGALWVIDNALTTDPEPLGRKNIGDGQQYTLEYMTTEDMDFIGLTY